MDKQKSPMLKLVLFSCLLLACGQLAAPTPCQEVDYYGAASWQLNSHSLLLVLNGDLVGIFRGVRDSNQVITGSFTGKFTAPLGDLKFTEGGTIFFQGELHETDTGFETDLIVTGSDSSFGVASGDLDLAWNKEDAEIWYVGTLCFE